MDKVSKNRIRNLAILIGVAASVLLVDQLSKLWVRTHYELMDPHDVIHGVLQILYIQNRGAAFGLFQGSVTILAVIALIMVTGVILFFLFSRKVATLEAVALSLVVSGALGNLIDRMSLGYVTDFIYLEFIHFPVFNIADIFVTAGTICFVVWILFYSSEFFEKPAEDDSGEERPAPELSSSE